MRGYRLFWCLFMFRDIINICLKIEYIVKIEDEKNKFGYINGIVK